MERFGKKTEILNDLLNINKDCSAIYRTYISETRNRPEAQIVVQRLEGVCRDCIAELHMRIDPTYGDPADAVNPKGMIYRAWVQDDDVYFARRTPGVFTTCEQKVNSIRKAYEQALKTGEELSGEVRELLNAQLRRLVAAFDMLTEYKNRFSVSSAMA